MPPRAVAAGAKMPPGGGCRRGFPNGVYAVLIPLLFSDMNHSINRLALVGGCLLLLSACGNSQGTTDTESPANTSISSGDSGTGGATGALADSTATVGGTAGSNEANSTPASTPGTTGDASGNTGGTTGQ